MKKYLANSTETTIKTVEILKETESSVYVFSKWYPQTGERRDKLTETRGYFDTWDEASAFLLSVEEIKIATLTRELSRRQQNIEKIKAMQCQ